MNSSVGALLRLVRDCPSTRLSWCPGWLQSWMMELALFWYLVLKISCDRWKCTPSDLLCRPPDPLDGCAVLCSSVAVPHSDAAR